MLVDAITDQFAGPDEQRRRLIGLREARVCIVQNIAQRAVRDDDFRQRTRAGARLIAAVAAAWQIIKPRPAHGNRRCDLPPCWAGRAVVLAVELLPNVL